jgi:alcohol-forming fatty acyl-CoA reductase
MPAWALRSDRGRPDGRGIEREEGSLGIAERLSGIRLGVTGVTGFVGQAFLARILDDVPEVELVVFSRPSAGGSARERIEELLTTATAFEGLRSRRALDHALERIEVVSVDLADDGPLTLPAIDVLVHVAGSVSFDGRIEEVFRAHTTGVDRIYAAAEAAGCTRLVHVSTAYVAARQPGPVPEGPCRDDLDWRAEADAAERLAEHTELVSRHPRMLARFLDRARRNVGTHGDQALAREAESARLDWVRERLIDAGRQRARTLGFADTYTMTKAMGEHVAEERFGRHHLSVVRPTIIESSLQHPFPGWLEGFKVADPIIIGLGRGDIPEFPGFPDAVVDIVPVDHVANTLVVAAAHPPPAGSPAYLTAGTGASNPVTLHRLYELVREHFHEDPLPGREGRGVQLPTWRFPGIDTLELQLRTAIKLTGAAARTIERTPMAGDRLRRLGRDLDRSERRLRTLDRFQEIYGIYAQTETVFLDDQARALADQLVGDDRSTFGFDPTTIDWAHYLGEVHVPAVSAFFRLELPARAAEARPPALQQGDPARGVLAVFDLDGTVADTDVLSTYLRARLADDPAAFVGAAAGVLWSLPRYAALDARGRERFLRAFYQRFEGADVAALDRLVADGLGQQLLHSVSPAAVRRVREHRELGHTTVLVTGALRSFCTPVEGLFDTVAACELATDANGIATGHLVAPPLVGATRANWLRAYAARADADLSASYAYADSRSDVPLLRSVGNPVAVDPDVVLHRLARKERWPIARWKHAARTPAKAG